MMKFFVAVVKWYDECEGGIRTDYVCVTGKDFADATSNIEKYYGDTLDNVDLEIVNKAQPLVILPDFETFEKIRVEGDC